MTDKAFVDSRLTFPADSIVQVIDAFLSLPEGLRPTHHRVGEDERRKAIGDGRSFRERKAGGGIGFMMYAPHASYDVTPIAGLPVVCNVFKIPAALAREFLLHMAKSDPVFGYCCDRDEEDHRNALNKTVGMDHAHAWVGRDPARFVPGLYWMTLLPEALANRHGVSLSRVEEIALEHINLGNGQHFFRFYEQPEDWKADAAVKKFLASQPGFFEIGMIEEKVRDVKSTLELLHILHGWD